MQQGIPIPPASRFIGRSKLAAMVIAFTLACVGVSPADTVWRLNGASTSSTYGQLVVAGPPVPPISRAMVLRYAETIELSDEQRRLVLDLHEAFVEEYRRDWLEDAEFLADNEARHTITQFRLLTDAERMEKEYERMRERRNALSRRFLDDYQLLLTPEQAGRWARIEAQRRRFRELGMVRDEFNRGLIDLTIAYQSIDTDQLGTDERAQIETLLERHIDEIETALETARRRAPRLRTLAAEYEVHQRELGAIRAPRDSPERQAVQARMDALAPSLLDEALALDRIYDNIRRIHGDAFDAIMEHLREESGEVFLDAVRPWLRAVAHESVPFYDPESRRRRFLNAVEVFENLATFQGLVGSPMLDKVVSTYNYSIDPNRLTGAEPLTSEQREQVEELTEEYRVELAGWSRSVNEDEEGQRNQPRQYRSIYFDGGRITLRRELEPNQRTNWRGAPGTNEQMIERAELEQRYIDRLRELLTFNQRALIATQ